MRYNLAFFLLQAHVVAFNAGSLDSRRQARFPGMQGEKNAQSPMVVSRRGSRDREAMNAAIGSPVTDRQVGSHLGDGRGDRALETNFRSAPISEKKAGCRIPRKKRKIL